MTFCKLIRMKYVTREIVKADRSTLFVFGEKGNVWSSRRYEGRTKCHRRSTKWWPVRTPDCYFTDADADLSKVRDAILWPFQIMRETILDGRNVVIPIDGLGTGLADLPRRAPRIFQAIELRIKSLEQIASRQTVTTLG